MVTNSSQDFALLLVDYQIDYNIKLIIFGAIIFYAFLFYFMRRNLVVDSLPKALFKLFSGVYIYITAVFIPLFTIMLFREYKAIDLWTLVLQGYGLVFFLLFVSLFFLGTQKVLDLFNIDFDLGFNSREKKRYKEQ
jgi:hypothetical protein